MAETKVIPPEELIVVRFMNEFFKDPERFLELMNSCQDIIDLKISLRDTEMRHADVESEDLVI